MMLRRELLVSLAREVSRAASCEAFPLDAGVRQQQRNTAVTRRLPVLLSLRVHTPCSLLLSAARSGAQRAASLK